VAINNSTNAALLAARILGSTDAGVSERMQAYMADMEAEVMRKREKMGETGWLEYKGLS
jgi:phosphoribosylaminoimidazole carboxylase